MPRNAKGAATAAGSLTAAAATIATPPDASRAPSTRATPAASPSIISASLWAPPTTSTSTSGFSATNAAAGAAAMPREIARRETIAAIPRTDAAASAFIAHIPAGTPIRASG